MGRKKKEVTNLEPKQIMFRPCKDGNKYLARVVRQFSEQDDTFEAYYSVRNEGGLSSLECVDVVTGRTVGFLVAQVYENLMELILVALLDKYKKKGYAEPIMKKFKEEFAGMDILVRVDSRLTKAVQFFQRFGFIKYAKVRNRATHWWYTPDIHPESCNHMPAIRQCPTMCHNTVGMSRSSCSVWPDVLERPGSVHRFFKGLAGLLRRGL